MQRVFASFPEAAVLSIQLEGGALNTTCLERVSFPAAGMLTTPEGGALNPRYTTRYLNTTYLNTTYPQAPQGGGALSTTCLEGRALNTREGGALKTSWLVWSAAPSMKEAHALPRVLKEARSIRVVLITHYRTF